MSPWYLLAVVRSYVRIRGTVFPVDYSGFFHITLLYVIVKFNLRFGSVYSQMRAIFAMRFTSIYLGRYIIYAYSTT